MSHEFHNPQLDHLYFEVNKGTNNPLRSISMVIVAHDEGFEPTPKTKTKNVLSNDVKYKKLFNFFHFLLP